MSLRAGQYLAGEGYAKGPTPTLTERTDLESGRAGWEGATKGTMDRVRVKMGKISDKTHWVAGSPWGGTVSKKGDGR